MNTPKPGDARPEPTPELPRTDGDFRPPYFVLENAQSVVYEMEARGYGKEWKLLGLASRSYTERLERSLAEATKSIALEYSGERVTADRDAHISALVKLLAEANAKLEAASAEVPEGYRTARDALKDQVGLMTGGLWAFQKDRERLAAEVSGLREKLEAAGSSAARTEATLWQRKFEEAKGRIGDLAAQLRAAQQEADTWEARTRWLMERASYNGGGNGGKFNISFETPLDSECDITQLDAARSAANVEGK